MVILRKIAVSDTDNIVKWRNLDSVKKNLFTQSKLSSKQHLDWLKNKVETGNCIQYIIVIDENGKQKDIGTVFIKNIDRRNLKGEFGIFIGESAYRGKGYAKAAIAQILDFGFYNEGLNRIYLSVMADNYAGINAYKNAGFEVEGILKEDYFRDSQYIDVILMGVTKKMWKNMRGGG